MTNLTRGILIPCRSSSKAKFGSISAGSYHFRKMFKRDAHVRMSAGITRVYTVHAWISGIAMDVNVTRDTHLLTVTYRQACRLMHWITHL